MQIYGADRRRRRPGATAMLTAVSATWRWIWNAWPWSRWRIIYVEDAPEVPAIGGVYIVGGRKHPFQAVMDCPCGCRSPIWLDLMPGNGQRWTAQEGTHGIASLKPSIWRTDGCRSHFVLKNGRVHWC